MAASEEYTVEKGVRDGGESVRLVEDGDDDESAGQRGSEKERESVCGVGVFERAYRVMKSVSTHSQQAEKAQGQLTTENGDSKWVAEHRGRAHFSERHAHSGSDGKRAGGGPHSSGGGSSRRGEAQSQRGPAAATVSLNSA